MTDSEYRKDLIERLSNDPKELSAYVQASVEYFDEDGDVRAFVTALRTAAIAQGGVCALAKKVGLSPTTLYKALSKQGNPTIGTLRKILHGFDQKLSVIQ